MPDEVAVPAHAPKTEAMRIVTGCVSREQFVAVFHPFFDEHTCFISSAETRPVGRQLAFSMRLADGTPMLRGACVVREAWATAENPFKRAGLQLEIGALSPESVEVFEQLLAKRRLVAAEAAPELAASELPSPPIVAAAAPEMPQQIEQEPTAPEIPQQIEQESTAPILLFGATAPPRPPPAAYKTETRTPGSAIVLPANPLTDVDDAALEAFFCQVIEDADGSSDVELEDVLAMPRAPVLPDAAVTPRAAAPGREAIATLLGVAPITVTRDAAPVTIDSAPLPAEPRQPRALPVRPRTEPPVRDTPTSYAPRPQRSGTEPLARSRLQAMTKDERFWLACAIGAALLTVLVVIASTLVSVG